MCVCLCVCLCVCVCVCVCACVRDCVRQAARSFSLSDRGVTERERGTEREFFSRWPSLSRSACERNDARADGCCTLSIERERACRCTYSRMRDKARSCSETAKAARAAACPSRTEASDTGKSLSGQ